MSGVNIVVTSLLKNTSRVYNRTLPESILKFKEHYHKFCNKINFWKLRMVIVSLLILRSTPNGSLVICKKIKNIQVFIENVPDHKNLPFTDNVRDRHFSISQSHGRFFPVIRRSYSSSCFMISARYCSSGRFLVKNPSFQRIRMMMMSNSTAPKTAQPSVA